MTCLTPSIVSVSCEICAIRIAFLNYTYGTNGIRVTHPNVVDYTDKDVIRQDIARARALRPDAIIACMHWGDEYQSLPNARQKELADWLLREGVISEADLHRLRSVRPAEIFNLPLNRFEPGDPADFFLFDPEEKWTVSRETLYSKSYNTPFLGQEMQGRVRHHWIGGVQLF